MNSIRFVPHTGRQNQQSKSNDIQNMRSRCATNPTGPECLSEMDQSNHIHALLSEHLESLNSNASARSANKCSQGQIPCRLSNQCIPAHKWCDLKMDCVDSSDETMCSCVDRLRNNNERKICDGYIDCPDASDEVGCFGCGANLVSCYHNEKEFLEHNGRTICYSKADRCDGTDNCLNSKDEEDCSRILINVGQPTVSVYSDQSI